MMGGEGRVGGKERGESKERGGEERGESKEKGGEGRGEGNRRRGEGRGGWEGRREGNQRRREGRGEERKEMGWDGRGGEGWGGKGWGGEGWEEEEGKREGRGRDTPTLISMLHSVLDPAEGVNSTTVCVELTNKTLLGPACRGTDATCMPHVCGIRVHVTHGDTCTQT